MSVAPSTSLEGILYFTEEAQESNSDKKPHSLMGVPCILRPMVETLSISHATRHVNSGRQSPVDAQLQCYQGSSLAAVAEGWEPQHHGKKLISQYQQGISIGATYIPGPLERVRGRYRKKERKPSFFSMYNHIYSMWHETHFYLMIYGFNKCAEILLVPKIWSAESNCAENTMCRNSGVPASSNPKKRLM